MQLAELQQSIEEHLKSFTVTAQSFNFRHLALKHHATAGNLESCLDTVLAFTRSVLVRVTPVTEVGDENRLAIFWLSTSMPPSNPTHVSFRCAPDLLKVRMHQQLCTGSARMNCRPGTPFHFDTCNRAGIAGTRRRTTWGVRLSTAMTASMTGTVCGAFTTTGNC